MKYKTLFAFVGAVLALSGFGFAQEAQPQILITDVRIFDGTTNGLSGPTNVLIEGNLIARISSSAISAPTATVVGGAGRTLMPGLIDAHSHMYMNAAAGVPGMETTTWDEIGARAAHNAYEWLIDGFTSVREMGGGGSGLKKTIDAGLLPGPRIYPTGAFLSQTSGHADFRALPQRNRNLTPFVDSNSERLGISLTVDGRDAIIAAVRQNFSQGATQIKIMTGGGVASVLDPLHTMQFLPEEIEAAVAAAKDWDTYVAAHVFSDEGIRRSVDAGVMSIEHGFFASQDTLSLMKQKGVFLVSQMTGISPYLAQLPALTVEPNKSKLELAQSLSTNFVENVKAVQPKMAFGIDIVFAVGVPGRQQRDHEKYYHAELFGNYAMLKAATSAAGELLAMSGKANPYPNAKLGVVEEGAYADLLVVDGNPLEDITAIGGNAKWYDAEPRKAGIETIRMIMKDGKIYKNTLSSAGMTSN